MPLPLKPEIIKIARNYFSGEQPAFATTLLAILFKTYGVQVLEWDGLTIEMEVKEDFGVDMPSRVYDKLMALITALSNDAIYKDVTFFDEFVSAINGRGFGTEDDVPAVDDVAWAVAELTINDPRPFGREPYWYRNIRIYTRVVLDDEGMDIPPQVLGFAEARTPKSSVNEEPADYAATWGEKQAKADEIDAWVSERMVALVQQLMEVGVDFSQRKKAEWTSDDNMAKHVDKHSWEFGGPDKYVEAEKELTKNPPADAEVVAQRCEGKQCATKRVSGATAMVWVSRDKDGKTVTLYKRL